MKDLKSLKTKIELIKYLFDKNIGEFLMKHRWTILWKLFLIQMFLFQFTSVAYSQNKYEEGKLYRHKLDNGLEVLTIERHIAPLIYHQLTYKVGSRNERLGITGISHVVEHMMFKGTEKYGKGKASKTISENSGIFNAFTANDMTSYFEYIPANKIELAMEIESDRMMNCLFDPKEFDSEIEVIKQERRMRSESSPNGIFHETMNSVAYVSHPNRDPIIGWPSDLDNVTRDEAFNYYKTFYTPNNSFLVLVGDFNTNEILDKVKKYYSNIPKGPEVKDIFAVEQPQKVRKTFSVFHNDVADPSIRMAFHVPTYKDPDAPALKLAGMILCERNRDARLYKSLVEKNQLATSAAGGFGMAKDPGLFSISASLRPDSSVDKVEQLIWEEISKMQNELVSDKEFQKVKNRYKFNEVTSYIKNPDIGSRISNWETYYGYDMMNIFYNKVLNVTKEDIQNVMKKYFNPDKVTIGYMYPKDKSKIKSKIKKQTDEQSGDENQEGMESEDNKPENYFYFKSPEQIYDDLVALSDEEIKPRPIEPLIKTFTLKNGVKLYTVESHLVPDIAVVGTIETGNITEANEGNQPGIGSVLGDVMNRGTENFTYDELSERMAFVPFQFFVSGSWRSFTFQGYSLIDDVDEMMKTGLDIITNPAFRDEDIKKVKARHQISAKNMLKRTGMKAFYYMYNNLFSDHPYSKVRSTEESIKSIKKEDLVALYKKYINPSKLTLLMVGDKTPEEMKDLAEKYFGEWKSTSEPVKEIPIPPINELKRKEIKIFPEKDYTECTINIGFAPFNHIDPAETEIINVMNYILSESALTSRMGVELRDKQGLIYGIKSELWAPNDSIGYWKFNTKTGPQNVEKVITGIFGEIKKLFADGITDEELTAAKNRKLGLLPFYTETPNDVASIVYKMISNKIPLNDFDKKGERIKAVTKEDVMRIAKKYFTLDRFIIVVDGPLEENSLDYLVDKLN